MVKIKISLTKIVSQTEEEVLEELKRPIFEWEEKWRGSANPQIIKSINECKSLDIVGDEYLSHIIIDIRDSKRGLSYYQFNDLYSRIEGIVNPRSVNIV